MLDKMWKIAEMRNIFRIPTISDKVMEYTGCHIKKRQNLQRINRLKMKCSLIILIGRIIKPYKQTKHSLAQF